MKKIIGICVVIIIIAIPSLVGAVDYANGTYYYNSQVIQDHNGNPAVRYDDGRWEDVPEHSPLLGPNSEGDGIIFRRAEYTPSGGFIGEAPQNLSDLIGIFLSLISQLVPVVFGLALLFFFWGLAQFIWAAGRGNEERVKSGKQLMFWGVIALFVMFSIYGIIALLVSDFGVGLPIRLLPTQ